MKTNDGGPAFPKPDTVETEAVYDGDRPTIVRGEKGMSLRQWYAGQALVGILSNPETFRQRLKPVEVAQGAFNESDAMLAAEATPQAQDAGRAALLEACKMVLDDPGLSEAANTVIRAAIARAEGRPS